MAAPSLNALNRLNLNRCEPPLWAMSAHAQTVLAYLLPSKTLSLSGERFDFPLAGGDILTSRFFPGSRPVVCYLFHGLAGSIESSYMQRTARICQELGISVYLCNHRGCGEGAGLATEPYHSGRGEDLSAVIEAGRKRHPGFSHIAIGFSLSGSALLNLLAGRRGHCKPDVGIVVNSPIHLESASRMLHQGLNRLYDFRFVCTLMKELKVESKRRSIKLDPRLSTWMTLYDFDEYHTAPAAGFKDRQDYYDRCSTWQHLQDINTPTLMITSEDDPFVPYEHYEKAKLSPSVILHAEKKGGHMGYLNSEVTARGDRRWLDYALESYLKNLISQ